MDNSLKIANDLKEIIEEVNTLTEYIEDRLLENNSLDVYPFDDCIKFLYLVIVFS